MPTYFFRPQEGFDLTSEKIWISIAIYIAIPSNRRYDENRADDLR